MRENRAPYSLALVRDALGQSGIEEGLKLAKGLRVGDVGMPAGDGDLWLEHSIRISTALGAGAAGDSQTLAVLGAWQPVVFDSELWDTDDVFDAALSASRMTIVTPGVYVVNGYCYFSAGGLGQRMLGILLNGAVIISARSMPNAAAALHMEVNTTWLLAEGEYVELVAYHDLGVALGIQFQHFSVVRVP